MERKGLGKNALPEYSFFRILMAPLPANVNTVNTPEHPPNPLLGCHMQEHLDNPLPFLPSISWTKSKAQTQHLHHLPTPKTNSPLSASLQGLKPLQPFYIGRNESPDSKSRLSVNTPIIGGSLDRFRTGYHGVGLPRTVTSRSLCAGKGTCQCRGQYRPLSSHVGSIPKKYCRDLRRGISCGPLS